MSVLGTNGGTITKRTRKYSADGSLVKTVEMPAAYESTYLATIAIGDTDSGFILAEISSDVQGGKCVVTQTYVTASAYTIRYGGTGDPVLDGDTNATEERIELHPLYSGGLSDSYGYPVLTSSGNNYGFKGVESYLKPMTTYRRTTIESSFTWSESNLVSGVGECSAPTGLTGATSTKWLKIARIPTTQGDKTQLTEVWQYNPNGWAGILYTGGTTQTPL